MSQKKKKTPNGAGAASDNAGGETEGQKQLRFRLRALLRDHGYAQGENYDRACDAAVANLSNEIDDEELESWMVEWLDSEGITS